MKREKFNIAEADNEKHYKLRAMLVQKLGKRFIDQDSEYIASLEDLYAIYSCVNEYAFGNKLPNDPQLAIQDRQNEMAKATFLFNIKDRSIKPKIKVYREKDRDTPLFIASALCHEMIHYYDFLFGPLSKITDATFVYKGGKQLIGDYDAHSDYFQRLMQIIISGGIPVQIVHADKVKVRYYMDGKEIVDEANNGELPTLAQRAKMFYDAIKTDDLFIVQVKDDEVFVVMQ